MLVVMSMQQMNQGLWNMLPAMSFLWAALPALILGSGRFGLDYLLTKSPALRPRPSLLALASLLLPGCVKKAFDKTVVYLLDVSGHPRRGAAGGPARPR